MGTLRAHPLDVTVFELDQDLVVRRAHGTSILRLPWMGADLYLGRRLPELDEMPAPVRALALEGYRAGLDGEHGCFAFTSFGHAFTVDYSPVHGEHGGIDAVLGFVRPDRSQAPAAAMYETLGARLHATAGRHADDDAPCAALRARDAGDRALGNAARLRTGIAPETLHPLTPREVEVLTLVSLGLTNAEIGGEVCASPATVKQHLENVYRKLHCPDRAAAVALALRHGLID